ncbi:MAG: MBOAT family protein [Treponema sp.]|jgi:alginate O-acetyltransferase complex protein AlgI|nr:MBOAT family protein [Treponema sp.]
MLFSSITFLVLFLPVVLLLYYYCPVIKGRNFILLFCSLVFYAWGEPKYVLIMILSILFNYRMGLFIADETFGGSRRRIVLGIAVAGNLLVLFYFKYLGFAVSLVNPLFSGLHLPSIAIKNIIMPIGISFYTFQSISYIIDVYKDKNLVQRNVLDLGLFITFFPQLIAGPIVRYHDINEQIYKRTHNISLFSGGVERFIAGLAKKVLLANSFAEAADGIFELAPLSVPTYYSWIAIISYSLQIYYDFSGYSDMAIGLGKMFGFNFLENFDYPYISKSIREFWKRWHISLSRWFMDYVYIPLGGNRKGRGRTVINLYIVFFITGLWHGASVSFILWGLGHGTLSFIERIFGGKIGAVIKNGIIKRTLAHIYTMACVVLLWVFFRLELRESVEFISNMFRYNNTQDHPELSLLVDTRFYILLAAGIVLSAPWWRKIGALIQKGPLIEPVRIIKYGVCLCLLVLSMCSLASNAYNPFIYFRF